LLRARRHFHAGSQRRSASQTLDRQSMLLSSRIISVVIASKAKRSRLEDCGCGLVWIASPSLAMVELRQPKDNLL
jgi:hypothetical protein